jgi:thiamine-phosphate pyrophosphorylase
MAIGRLHVLTDFHFQQRFSHAALAEAAIAGGADTVQFRQKTGPLRARLRELERSREVCRQRDVPLLVDDDVALALAVGADGVHLGQDDLPIPLARRLLGPDAIIGATASAPAEAARAEAEGASYIGFGPVFPTGSKANPQPVRGLAGLEATCRAVSIPVIAIAGMTPERVASVLDAGAHGVAVMTAVTTAPDVAAAAARFRQVLNAALR